MELYSVLVTGANRGIGLEFVRQLSRLVKPPTFVFATYRSSDSLAVRFVLHLYNDLSMYECHARLINKERNREQRSELDDFEFNVVYFICDLRVHFSKIA